VPGRSEKILEVIQPPGLHIWLGMGLVSILSIEELLSHGLITPVKKYLMRVNKPDLLCSRAYWVQCKCLAPHRAEAVFIIIGDRAC
jgi:hypothetical protein